MIAYFDTSSVMSLVVDEAGTPEALRHWRSAERVASARIVYAEGRAALAQAARTGRISPEALPAAVERFEAIYDRLELVEITDRLVHVAGRLAEAHALRGYDSVHLAAAELARGDAGELVFIAGDDDLCRAAATVGFDVVRTS